MKNDEETIISNLLNCEQPLWLCRNTRNDRKLKDKDFFGLWRNDDVIHSKSNQNSKAVRKSRRTSVVKGGRKEKFEKSIGSENSSSEKYVLPHIKISSNKTMQIMKNIGVVSYEPPSWRFIVNKTYNYVERRHPKELLRNMNHYSRSKSSHHGKSKNKLLDPAAFLDEKMAEAFRIYNSYYSNKKRLRAIKTIYRINEENDSCTSKRLFSKNALSYIDNGSDDGEEETAFRRSKVKAKTQKSITVSKKSKKEVKRSKRNPSKPKKVVKDKKQFNFIKNVESSELFQLQTIESNSSFMKGPNKICNTSREIKKKEIANGSSNLQNSYLPTLNFSNYSERFYYVPPKFESKLSIKLPEINQGDFMVNHLQR